MVRLTAALISALNDGCDLATIETLTVPGRYFHEISGIDACEKLSRLDISKNSITSLESISMCTNLKWLSVAENKLTSLKGIETLTKLTVLNASRNAITSVSEISTLVELRALILNDNQITKVTRFDNLVKLNTLVLSHNPIRELGKSLNKQLELTKLSVSHCKIQILGASLKRCVALEELRLAHNQLSELPKEIERNGRLRILDLGSNNLQNWQSLQVLKALHSLSNLNLRGSPICSVADYEQEVKSLVPTLQILDGHPLVPGKVKRKYEGKKPSSKMTDESVGGPKRDTNGDQTKRTKVNSIADGAKEKGSRPPKDSQDEDAPDKPFVELIKAQPTEVKRLSDIRQDSGVVAVIDGKKDVGGVWKRKRGIEALTLLKEPEIGTGGPSSWDTPGAAITNDVAAAKLPPTSYSRWALKKK
ncbi:hypothetical protein KC19_6G094600 [Ceratodon purpureus]|uniref:Uncharacterized protein n=1 Tax=Ceratodon purpureus TaxID=3225 RepID=A0A8T0HCE1_CERPU|nr:hypothetical protein KC19_6G094600 [Ceratodon purpureus]